MTQYFDVDKVFGEEYDFSEFTTFPEMLQRRYQEIKDGVREDRVLFRFFDYLKGPEATGDMFTVSTFSTRFTAVGAQLQQVTEQGD